MHTTENEICLHILPEGKTVAMYTDGLQEIAPIKTERLSFVEFNETKQQWQVRHAQTNEILFTHAAYNACIEWEHTHFKNQLPQYWDLKQSKLKNA